MRSGPLTGTYSDEADDLVVGSGVTIGEGARFQGGRIVLSDGTRIGRNVEVNVSEELVLGRNAKVGDHSIVRGRRIRTGREFYTNHHAEIGGGSCFESTSQLEVGHWFHLGSYAIVNTAMPVRMGDEVGLGRMTNIYTHGAYLSEIDGFPVKFGPVTIGSRVWIPSATVNPGVTIGDDVVIAVGSVVTRDIPSGCLAAGTPAKVVRERAYPAPLGREAAMVRVGEALATGGVPHQVRPGTWQVAVGESVFDLETRTVLGSADRVSERARELLRRRGIRFKVDVVDGAYKAWD